MATRRDDVIRVPAILWVVLSLQGLGAPPLAVATAAGQAPAGARLDEVDLDAPDVGRPAAPPKTGAGADAPTAGADTPPAGADAPPAGAVAPPAGAVAPPAGADAPSSADDALHSSFEVRPWKRADLFDAAAAHFAAQARPSGAPSAAPRDGGTLAEVERALAQAGVAGVRGGPGSSAVGHALAREAEALASTGSTDRALEVAALALRAAPDDTGVASRVAYVRWRSSGVAAVGSVIDTVRRALLDPLRASDAAARLLGAAIIVVVALLAATTLALGVPALRLAGFDLWLLLPRGSSRIQGLMLVTLLAVLPVVVGAGAVVACLWVLTLACAYLTRAARIWAGVVGVFVVGLPFLVDGWARAVVVAGSDADRIAAALYDVDADDERAALRAREARGEQLPLLARAALAAAAHREGRVAEAVERWGALAEKSPESGWTHGGYGIALAAAGRDEVALSELLLCAERSVGDPDIAAIASFDASVLLQKAGRSERAQAVVNGAVPSSAGLMADMRRATFRSPDEVVDHNRAFVAILPPRRLLFDLARAPSPQSDAVTAPFARLLWGSHLPGPSAPAAFAAFVVVWGALARFAARLRPARSCARCGDAASRRVDGRDVPDDCCAACFHVFLAKKGRVEPAVRIRRERLVVRRGRIRGALIVALSLWPGLGHVFAGAVGRGAVLLLLSTSAVAGIAVVSDAVPGAAPSGPWSAWVETAPLLAVAAFLFLVSLRGALGLAEDERTGGRR